MSHASPDPGVLAHIRAWFEGDLEPEFEDLRAVAEKVRELAPALGKIGGVVTAMAKADPGLSPEIVAGVEEAASVVARIAAELAAAGM